MVVHYSGILALTGEATGRKQKGSLGSMTALGRDWAGTSGIQGPRLVMWDAGSGYHAQPCATTRPQVFHILIVFFYFKMYVKFLNSQIKH